MYDGSSDKSPELSSLCGTDIPGEITSTGSTMMVRLKSDGSTTGQGFKATYEIKHAYEVEMFFVVDHLVFERLVSL